MWLFAVHTEFALSPLMNLWTYLTNQSISPINLISRQRKNICVCVRRERNRREGEEKERKRETVLIASDRLIVRFVPSIRPRIIAIARRGMNRERYSHGWAGAYIRSEVRELRKISKARCGVAYWLTRLLPDQKARVEKKKRWRTRGGGPEQAAETRREGVMKHRADTPPWIFII